MISRHHKIQEKKLTRKAVLLLASSFVLLLLLFFLGIPLLVQFAAFVGGVKQSSVPVAQEDKTPPTPPKLVPLPEYTKEGRLTLTGRAEAGSTIKVFNGDQKIKEFLVGENANFSVEIPITEGKNDIWTAATDTAGNESISSSHYNVIYRTEPPKLTITKPASGEIFYGSNKTVTIEGETEPDAKVTVNERVAIVGSDRKFSQNISLSEGENKITVTASDLAGNETTHEITVHYTP